MVDPAPSGGTNTNTEKPPMHPAYSITNINSKVRTLDGKKVSYSNWVKLFTIQVRAYQVLHHIDGTKPPVETDPKYAAWHTLDSLILQWIYNTISDDLFARVIADGDLTAREAWVKLQQIFLNNKHARAATLENKFSNLTLSACSSFDDYCQTLKDLAGQLQDVDQPVTDSRLVIQMVRGLPVEYDTIGAIINQSKPTWDDARSMLEDEIQRQSARAGNTRDTVLLNTQSQTGKNRNTGNSNSDSNRSPYPNGYRGRNYDPAKAARGRGQSSRGDRNMGRGGRTQEQLNGQHGNYWTPHPQNYWQPPPSPYPSQAYNSAPAPYIHRQSAQQAHLAQQASPSAPPGFAQHGSNALNPSDIGTALNNMSLNVQDPHWYMDTGASSHITSDPGPQGWTAPFPSQ
ncbi:hypothetical protein QVD17_17331 [Tagetes erecta]|uniref:Uncharacterized protein n=1 Tax=Tagetes erecta TaxID=13708 RepID=A0AAD8KWM0_TARER|nr:hypothetical protein QVD17_17331 [Tagetes erecta]